MPDGDELTAARLVEILADAGEIDAGVEALEALQLRTPGAPELGRLQARLFAAEDLSPARKRAVLDPLRGGALEALARQGALIECAVAYRVLAAVFPDEPAWLARLGRIESVLSPLPGADDDPALHAVESLLARGATQQALAALRDLARERPDDRDLERRAEELRALLFDPTHTRPFRQVSMDDAARALSDARMAPEALIERLQRSLREGALEDALRDATTLALRNATARWIRLRDALHRLLGGLSDGDEAAATSLSTLRLDAVSKVDLWLRQGLLEQAREEARAGIAAAENVALAGVLAQRLADLDVVLGDGQSTPLPSSRPPHARGSAAPPSVSVEVQILRETPERPAPAVVSPTSSVESESTPLPAPRPSTPVGGDVRVGKRKIVRLR